MAATSIRYGKPASGLRGWISTVDHKEIGKRYIITSFLFLIAGGIEVLLMRLQLVGPDRHFLTPAEYDQMFSTHGMTMIFLYAMPVLSGFSNYIWPLVLGSRDMAFPRLNALSYWIYLGTGLFMYAGLVIGAGPNDGWFNDAPYSALQYNPGLTMDFYSLRMIFLGISTSAGAANFIVTLLRTRAPGMSINRLPAMDIVSDGLPVFCRRPLVGYGPVALSTVATMILGFGVWVHHMFAMACPCSRCRFSPAPR